MWKPFNCDNNLYLIKFRKSTEYSVYLNDLQSIWIQNLSEMNILEQLQHSNPLLDIKLDEATHQFVTLINEITSATEISLNKTNESIELILKTKVSNFGINFKFNFIKQNEDDFLKEMTVPLIQTLKYLEEQQKVLCTMLAKKDRELEEHKLEKGEISRTDLITEKFDENQINNIKDEKSMLNIFTNKSFWDKFVEQHGDLEANLVEVQSDPWNHIKRRKKIYSAKNSRKKGAGIKYT